ncbi:CPBP family intramembrane glutamic endopeptidase [Tessaracoccus sp. Y36]|uniref:CPBP family intramembrane glutamic endopeptidase n=1 Tax=Tessaracoccus sp. ZS01 TaxID=1906324 RepID=UPI001180355A|nr:CPBP family intramembrane glutamic endopeptidase [Tessaracoccus sp. ZS01]
MSQPPTPLALFHPGEAVDPPPGMPYPRVLPKVPFLGMTVTLGILLGFSAYALLIPLANQAFLGLGFLVRGGGNWSAYVADAVSYRLPDGPVAGQLALALLIPISLLLMRYVHGVKPRWLASVQPGMRWRYLLMTLVVAAVLLNAVVWAQWALGQLPPFAEGQPGWQGFLLLIVLSSPLQAAAEEFFFRGYLLQAIGSATGRAWVGVLGSALLFALMHGLQNPALFAHRLVFGLVAGSLVLVTGGLEAAIGAHIVNNILSYVYALFSIGLEELRATTGITWAEAGWNILAFVLFGLAAWWLARRLNLATTTP